MLKYIIHLQQFEANKKCLCQSDVSIVVYHPNKHANCKVLMQIQVLKNYIILSKYIFFALTHSFRQFGHEVTNDILPKLWETYLIFYGLLHGNENYGIYYKLTKSKSVFSCNKLH